MSNEPLTDSTTSEDVAVGVSVSQERSSAPLGQLHETFRRHLFLPDTAIVDFTAAVTVANRIDGDPVWALIVAPPSSGKTEALQSLSGLSDVHPLSALNPTTLISGAKRGEHGEEPSLLLRLPDNSLLVLKDFGTILSMREDARAEILGQLREVYDGQYIKTFGTGRSISWRGKLGFIAGTTPAIDLHHSVINVLGERFLYCRVPESNRREMGHMAALTSQGDTMREELRAAMRTYVDGIDPAAAPSAVPAEMVDQLVSLADLGTWARSSVYRDRYSRDIEVAPSREAPGRFIKQIVSLWRALTVMQYPDPMSLVRRVALDSMPPARAAVLRTVGEQGVCNTNALRDETHLSTSAHRRLLEDMEALGLLEIEDRGGSHQPATWSLSSEARTTWALSNFEPAITERGEKREITTRDSGAEEGFGFAALYAL
jgi:hypothetical protein